MAKQPIRIQKTRVTQSPASRKFAARGADEGGHEETRLIDYLYDAVIITRNGGHIVDMNTRAASMFLFQPDEFLDMNIMDLITNASDSLVRTLERNVQAQKHTLLRANCLRKNKSRFSAEMAVTQVSAGTATGLCFAIRDITRKKQTEDQLDSEHNAVQNASSGMAISDNDCRIQYANPAVYELLGVEDASELTLLKQLWADEDTADGVLNACLEGEQWSGEIEAAVADDGSTFLQASIAPNLNARREQIGLIVSLMDISERKRMESDLQDAQTKLMEEEVSKARVDTMETLAYELNSPLQILLSLVEMDKNSQYKVQIDRMLEILKELHDPDKLEAVAGQASDRPLIASGGSASPCDLSRILIADDEKVLRTIFEQLINTFKPELTVTLASDGEEAIKRFEEHQPAIVMLDLAMPGMSGEDAFNRIEEICEEKSWQEPAIIICTGFMASSELSAYIEKHPLHMILNKPVGKEALMEAIESRLALPHFASNQ